jgi:L-alanine-DL-glutamate epimerase-like enolase superfamily enzyme
LEHEIAQLFGREEADEIERIWRKAWWALHYGGRGSPTVLAISAFDIALWDLKAKRALLPLWNLLGGFDARVPCYAGGIISASTSCCGKPRITSPKDSAPSR